MHYTSKINLLVVSRNQSLGGKSQQNQIPPWFYSFIHRREKMLFTWQKEGKLWDRKGVWRANHDESNIHGIRVDHFWNPAGISLAESLSEEKTSLG